MNGLAQPQNPAANINSDEGDPTIGSSMTEQAASPDEQAMYDALIEPMLGLIHGQETSKKIEEALKDGLSIGQLTFQIATTIIGQIEQQGKQVPLEVLQQVAEDIVEDLVEISVVIGVIEDNEKSEEQAFVNGLMEAVELYGRHLRDTGKMSPEENQKHLDSAMNLGGFDKNKVTAAIQQAQKQEV